MLSVRKGIKLIGSGAAVMAIGAGLLGAAYPASASTASATPAATSAAPLCSVLSPAGQPVSDSIKLPNVGGISFGTGGLDKTNNPYCGGTLQWQIPSTGVEPRLTGTLYMQNSSGKTAHVLMEYYDIHGNKITGRPSPDQRASTNSQSFPVTIDMFSLPTFYRMTVSTEVKYVDPTTHKVSYVSLTRVNAYMGSATHPASSCKIDADKLEVGGAAGVSGGHPVNSAVCDWVITPTTVQARLTGTQYFEDGLGREARVVLSTYDVRGNWLGDTTIADHSPKVNGVTSWPANGSSSPNDRIYRAQVVLQLLNGSTWEQHGSAVNFYI